MPRPTMLETAIKEWSLVRDEVLDIHTAVFGRRSFGDIFIQAVLVYCDVLITEEMPEWKTNYWQIITEIKRFRELIEDMQNKESDFMRDYAVYIDFEYGMMEEETDAD